MQSGLVPNFARWADLVSGSEVPEEEQDEIKKQNLTKQNLQNFTNPYFDLLDKIQKKLDNLEDKVQFALDNKKLSMAFDDIKKNFVRRVKAAVKKNK